MTSIKDERRKIELPQRWARMLYVVFVPVCRMTQTTELLECNRLDICLGDVGRVGLSIACAGKHIEHLPSLSLVEMPVPDCVWNNFVSLRC